MSMFEPIPCVVQPGYIWVIAILWFMNVFSVLFGLYIGSKERKRATHIEGEGK